MAFEPIDQAERIHADHWDDEKPTKEEIEQQRSIEESRFELEQMYD